MLLGEQAPDRLIGAVVRLARTTRWCRSWLAEVTGAGDRAVVASDYPEALRNDRIGEITRVFRRGYWSNPAQAPLFTSAISIAAVARALEVGDGAPGELGDHADTTWAQLLQAPGYLLAKLASAATPAPERETARELASALLERGLISSDISWLTLTGRQDNPALRMASVTEAGSGRWIVVTDERTGDPNRRIEVIVVARGTVQSAPGLTVEKVAGAGPREAGDIARLLERAPGGERRGEPTWDPQWATEFAQLTGVTRAEATLIVAGLPGRGTWERLFLPTECRKILGLSAAEAVAGRDALAGLSTDELVAVVAAGVGGQYPDHPDVPAMAQEFRARLGARVAVPDEVLLGLDRAFAESCGSQLRSWLSAEPGEPAPITVEYRGEGVRPEYGAGILAWLGYHLAGDDPLRGRLADLHESFVLALRQGTHRVYLDLAGPELLGLLGLDEASIDGQIVQIGGLQVDGSRWPQLYLLPARVTSLDEPVLRVLGAQSPGWAVVAAFSPEFAEFVQRSGVRVDGAPHDPQVTVPDLVVEAGETLGVGADAARLFLQLLALPDPTTRNVQTWNGWTAARLKKVSDELEAAHVDGQPVMVRAKRARAGRQLFLPGGWVELKAPNLPVESWKADWLHVVDEQASALLAGQALPVLAHADLFTQMWQRWLGGDRPGLEAVVPRTRRGRR